jgi:hypothetical protein
VFVEADAQKRVQRLYWVQFEGYLPDNTHTYGYPFTETLTHDGLLFDVTVWSGRTDQAVTKPGSDTEHVLALVKKAGYQMPPETMAVRLVHLLDEAKRKELMFIVAEDLAASGSTAEELQRPEGKAKWEVIKPGLIERARERIDVKATQ